MNDLVKIWGTFYATVPRDRMRSSLLHLGSALTVAAAASLSDGSDASLLHNERGLVSRHMKTLFAVPLPPSDAEKEKQENIATQKQMLESVLKPMAVEYVTNSGDKQNLLPSDLVLVIVPRPPMKGDTFWNAVKEKVDFKKRFWMEDTGMAGYLVHKDELRSVQELRGAAEGSALPFLSTSYQTVEGEIRMPMGYFFVTVDPERGKAAVNALHAFAKRHKLECREVSPQSHLYELRMTNVTRPPSVFSIMEELRKQRKTIGDPDLRMLNSLTD